MEFATNARAIGGFVRWMTRDIDSQQTDRTAKVPLSGAQAAALLRIGGEPMRETERADGGTNGAIVGAAAPGTAAPQARTGRTAGRITLAVLGLAGFSVLVQANSEQVPPNAPQSSGLVGRAPDTGASHVHDTLQGHHKMLNKITGVTAAAVVGIAATVAGAQSAAVQWRVEDGGNGHWYEIQQLPTRPTCVEAESMAIQSGARPIALETLAENDFFRLLRCSQVNQHLSGWQDLRRVSNQWTWGSGEPFVFQSWSAGQPDSGDTATIDWAGPNGQCETLTWGDENCTVANLPAALFLEWSADCNNDGIVDYGQIRIGQLADTNNNGVSDTCECIGDIDVDGTINGSDLGVLLAYWGPTTSAAASIACDLNVDGVVNGSDLGILLAYWGPCSN